MCDLRFSDLGYLVNSPMALGHPNGTEGIHKSF